MKSVNIMAHMIAGFPSEDVSGGVAEAIIRGGAAYLELQFPYSDPSADGPVIQRACARALREGFTKEKGFSLVRKITSRFDIPVFIMSYAGLVFSGGVQTFVEGAKEAGACGLIIPDLTPGHDEGLYSFGRKAGLAVVPVIAPSVTEERLKRVAEEGAEYVYTALRTGVTGSKTEIGEAERNFLDRAGRCGEKIIAGFGIRSREQVLMLQPYVHAPIVGSLFVEMIEKNENYGDTVLYKRVNEAVRHLVTGETFVR